MESFPNLLQRAGGTRRLDEKVCVCVTALQDFELQRQRSLQRRSKILAAVFPRLKGLLFWPCGFAWWRLLLLGRASASPTVTCWLGLSSFAIYIYIYKSSVRPLGLVPSTIEPKSRANPVLRHCLALALNDNDFLPRKDACSRASYSDFAFLWLWLTRISSRKDAGSRALFFVSSPTASGAQLPFETNSISIFLTSVLSFFTRLKTFTHKKSTIGIRNSAFESSGSKRTSLREPWAAPPFRHLSTGPGPCLHCVTVHCLASGQKSVTSPRKSTASFPSTKNGACRPRLAPQCLHSLVICDHDHQCCLEAPWS